jgi:hypothetical protein
VRLWPWGSAGRWVIAGRSFNRLRIGELPRRFSRSARHRDHFYVAQTAQRLHMHASHESNSKNRNFYFFHFDRACSPKTYAAPLATAHRKVTQPGANRPRSGQKLP